MRNQEIRIRIDDESKERLELKAKKKGMPLATYCRSVLLIDIEVEVSKNYSEEDILKRYNQK